MSERRIGVGMTSPKGPSRFQEQRLTNGWAYNGERQLAGFIHDQGLRQGLGERVGVWPVPENSRRRERVRMRVENLRGRFEEKWREGARGTVREIQIRFHGTHLGVMWSAISASIQSTHCTSFSGSVGAGYTFSSTSARSQLQYAVDTWTKACKQGHRFESSQGWGWGKKALANIGRRRAGVGLQPGDGGRARQRQRGAALLATNLPRASSSCARA